jgi:hemerythrin
MVFAWDRSLIVGVPLIDQQHQELFGRLDRLVEAIRAGRSAQEVGGILDFLAGYVKEHFSAEEKVMEEAAYPEREAHAAEHRRFELDLAALRREFEQDGPSALVVVRVNARITLWLRDHIYRTDRALGVFLSDPYRTYQGS